MYSTHNRSHLGGGDGRGVDEGEAEAVQRQRHDGQGEVGLDGEEGQHEAAAGNTSVNISATSTSRIPVDCGPDEDGPLGPDSPAHVSYNRHGGTLEDSLGGGKEHKVIISEL